MTVGAALRVIHRENYSERAAVALGRALRDERFVQEWVQADLGSDWTPPIEARRLTTRQRQLVGDLIRELANGGSDAGQAEAEKSPNQRSALLRLWGDKTPDPDLDQWREQLAADQGDRA